MNLQFKLQRGAVLAFVLVMLLLLTLTGTRMIQQNKQQLEMANNARLQAQEFANAESKLAQAKNLIGAYPAHDNSKTDYFGTSLNSTKNKYNFYGSGLPITHKNHQCTPLRTSLPYRQDIMSAGPIKDTQGVQLQGAYILEAKCMSLDGYIRLCSTYDEATGITTAYPKARTSLVGGKDKGIDMGVDTPPCAGTPCTADEIAASGFVTCPRIDTTTNKLYCGPNNTDCTTMTDAQITSLCSNSTRDSTVSSLTNDVCYQRYDPQCADTSWDGTNVTSCSVSPHECPVPVYRVHVISETETTTRELLADMIIRCGS
jgi:hypothetical protein